MFLTNVLFKKAKSKWVYNLKVYNSPQKKILQLKILLLNFRMIMVLMESVVSGHQMTKIRERLADKLEFIRFDPYSK